MQTTYEITNTQDIIDSRDVIARIEHLQNLAEDEASEEEREELKNLLALDEEAEGCCPDWQYGEALIRDSYFEQYARELAEDCAPSPEIAELIGNDGCGEHWPLTCCHIDWDKAVSDLKMDYTAVDFGGVQYWIR